MTKEDVNGTVVELSGETCYDNNAIEERETAEAGGACQAVPGPEIEKPAPYAGMPKEVLLLYSGQARYRLPREIIFWLAIVTSLMLAGATVAIIVVSPKCLNWWQSSPLYQLYPRSFQDSDSDGVGDLRGIQTKLSYFEYLNVKSISIGSIYKSSSNDFGYEVEDFREVDEVFGTMEDFENLLAAMHDKGLKLVMDFIPNHTSDKHVWFQMSRNRTGKFTEYYVWHDCHHYNGSTTPPNNWLTVYGDSAWDYDAIRGQCYYHQFGKGQPDLNYHSYHVQEEMIEVLKFWLQKGVDGFRVDAVKFLLEADHFRDEPQVDVMQRPENISSYSELHHDYTTTQLGLHDILRNWRNVLDEYSREPGKYRSMFTDSFDDNKIATTMLYYGSSRIKEADFPFNFYLTRLENQLYSRNVFELVDLWMANMPQGHWPNWMVGNQNVYRVMSWAGQDYINVINMLLLTLPGTPATYYGEEIGMDNINLNSGNAEDPGKLNVNPEVARSPMQWSSDDNAGFSKSNRTWVPVHSEYRSVNVQMQKNDSGSTLAVFRALALLREKELPLHRGWMCYVYNDSNVFAYARELDGFKRAYLIILNFGQGTSTDLQSKIPGLPKMMHIRLSTRAENNGQMVKTSAIGTARGEGLVLEYHPEWLFHRLNRYEKQCFISDRACYLSMLDILYKTC
ncbi:neutral and basic amino acid transport protein rBAT [Erpetoichthys calabaricus]|uniref:neutral and basic amino acid transport protein rBAT n=1 Tax=Erpetoichthys calabaricus TaxID=27687 RepID=UPI002234990B|nr:neutral and basic amino acid transport protein rBAT [Erpetoichthys calabaricus]